MILFVFSSGTTVTMDCSVAARIGSIWNMDIKVQKKWQLFKTVRSKCELKCLDNYTIVKFLCIKFHENLFSRNYNAPNTKSLTCVCEDTGPCQK
jgi:hypothetical protein